MAPQLKDICVWSSEPGLWCGIWAPLEPHDLEKLGLPKETAVYVKASNRKSSPVCKEEERMDALARGLGRDYGWIMFEKKEQELRNGKPRWVCKVGDARGKMGRIVAFSDPEVTGFRFEFQSHGELPAIGYWRVRRLVERFDTEPFSDFSAK